MAAFRDAVFSDLDQQKRMQIGENGCMEYTDAGVGSDLLALSQMVRGGTPQDVVAKILTHQDTNELVQLFVLTFVVRNARGGKGEKDLSYDIFLQLLREFPETAKALLPMYIHYGYWKDLLLLMHKALEHPNYLDLRDGAMELMKHQWQKDVSALEAYEKQLKEASDDADIEKIKKVGPRISLLAKWLPREGKALDKKIKFVEHFSKMVFPLATTASDDAWQSRAKQLYRKQLSKMTAYFKLPEVLLAAQRADEIEISRVASKATKLLSKAFLNESLNGGYRSEDVKRMRLRDIFLDSIIEKGLKGGQVFPHEIVKTILANPNGISKGMTLALDAQWKDLWAGIVKAVKAKAAEEGLEFDPTKMVPISDVSGSMMGTPMDVAIALGIGISEITHESFRNMVMTFDSEPQWFHLEDGDTIVDKVQKLSKAPWGMSTDFSKAYNLILDVCEKNQLKREDMPCLIVFSDMQFDQACYGSHKDTMFEHIQQRVKTVAEKLNWDDNTPSPIVFWNLRRTGGHPVDKATEGTVLLSGYSPSLLKMVMNGEALKEEEVEVVQKDGTVKTEKVRVTPEQILKKMLEDSMYDPVRKILGSSMEGALKEYEPPFRVETSSKENEDMEFELIV